MTNETSHRISKENKEWIDNQDWYQIIELGDGTITPGKFDTRKRFPFFDKIDFSGKSVLDVGCNSGAYCLMSKRRGAGRVIGVDINENRLKQARKLAELENLDITFEKRGIETINSIGTVDIVFCIAVLTEVQDILGALNQLKSVIGQAAYIELSLAKPIGYLSWSTNWIRNLLKFDPFSLFELRETRVGFMLSPSLNALRKIFGRDFRIQALGKGVRYDMVRIVRR